MNWIKKHKSMLILLAIFGIHIFLRFYHLKERATFGWDQIDNAWAAYRILVDHNYPIQGMMAKLNSGIAIGPLYYYYISIFYFFTNLHPIASPIIAGTSSIINFFVLYIVIKKIFGKKIAYVALFINAVGFQSIIADRLQWPVNFIPTLGLLIFYFLYKILNNNIRFIPLLAIAIGLSFHIHVTSIFYPIIIFFTLPWWPKTKQACKYIIASSFVFIAMIAPTILTFWTNKAGASNAVSYGTSYYHGFHVRRFMQLYHDAYIQFQFILEFKFFRPLVFFFYPLFIFLHRIKTGVWNIRLMYLIFLWIIVPWIVFTLYSGEITDYYFSMNRYIALGIISYITVWFFEKNMITKVIVGLFWIYYGYIGIRTFFLQAPTYDMQKKEDSVKNIISAGQQIQFVEGSGESYMYSAFTKNEEF